MADSIIVLKNDRLHRRKLINIVNGLKQIIDHPGDDERAESAEASYEKIVGQCRKIGGISEQEGTHIDNLKAAMKRGDDAVECNS